MILQIDAEKEKWEKHSCSESFRLSRAARLLRHIGRH